MLEQARHLIGLLSSSATVLAVVFVVAAELNDALALPISSDSDLVMPMIAVMLIPLSQFVNRPHLPALLFLFRRTAAVFIA